LGLFDFLKKKPAATPIAGPAASRGPAAAPLPQASAADLAPAMEAGDYAKAAVAFMQQSDAGTQTGIATTALLLAYAERFDEAIAMLQQTTAPAVDVIVSGEQARWARWRDPAAAGRLGLLAPTASAPMYAGLAVALLHRDEALAAKVFSDFAQAGRPVAGQVTLRSGTVRPFKDLRDYDDGIGQMFELFVGNGVTYAPMELVRRLELKAPSQFIEQLAFRATLTTRTGDVIHGFMPLLYACSTTAGDSTVRVGRTTTFDYVGRACRAIGQRDFKLDGSVMMGMQNIAAIDFA
jgi:protein involved in temperature-dependent protein secretion